MKKLGRGLMLAGGAVGLVALFGAFTATVSKRRENGSAFAGGKTPEVRFVAVDYAYVDVPATLPAGLTYFSFKNAGKMRHEMSLLRLERGVSVAAVLENIKAGGKGRAALLKTVGILIEPPGGSTIGWLAMELKKGETYMLVCTLKDKPDAKPHLELGMYSAFTVR